MTTVIHVQPFGSVALDFAYLVIALIVMVVAKHVFRSNRSLTLWVGFAVFLALGLGVSLVPVETHQIKLNPPSPK